MTLAELLQLFRSAGRPALTVSKGPLSAVLAPDLEARIFYSVDGVVVSRVNAAAITGHTTVRTGYLNPGGDGIWPAPEGTCFGYEYGTGAWRVPPSLVNARFEVESQSADTLTVWAEVDLVNARQLGIPCIFRRTVSVAKGLFDQRESIEYIGARALSEGEFLLAPWSLCQFDSGPASTALLPAGFPVRDLYTDTTPLRTTADGVTAIRTSATDRWQVALGPETPQISLRLPEIGWQVTRATAPLPPGQNHIDIADSAPDTAPLPQGIRYSVYNDPSYFMEIEAAGGCAFPLKPHDTLTLDIQTTLEKLPPQ